MRRQGVALPRTDVAVEEFLADLCDPGHAVRRLTFVADTRIARMLWPEKVEWCNDTQWAGWTTYGFKPFGNLSDGLALARHSVTDANVAFDADGDRARVTIFSPEMRVGVRAEDERVEYAVCKAVLKAVLAFDVPIHAHVVDVGPRRPAARSHRAGAD